MPEDFTVFSDSDRHHLAYALCVAGHAGVGLAVGRFGGLGGVVALGAAGLVMGLVSCSRVEHPLRRKLFDQLGPLSEAEFARLATQTSAGFPGLSRTQVLDLLAAARQAAAQDPARYRC